MSGLPVRNSDPETSVQAAALAVTRRRPVADAIIALLIESEGHWTHDDLYETLRARHKYMPAQWPAVSPSGVRTRCSELVREGVVEMVTEYYGTSNMGNRAILWRLVR